MIEKGKRDDRKTGEREDFYRRDGEDTEKEKKVSRENPETGKIEHYEANSRRRKVFLLGAFGSNSARFLAFWSLRFTLVTSQTNTGI